MVCGEGPLGGVWVAAGVRVRWSWRLQVAACRLWARGGGSGGGRVGRAGAHAAIAEAK